MCEHEGETILCVSNLAHFARRRSSPTAARLQGCMPVELPGRAVCPPIGELPYLLTLHGYGFCWFRRTRSERSTRLAREERRPHEELPALVLFDGWNSLLRERAPPWRIGMAERVRAQLETEDLPRLLARQRGYAARGERIEHAVLVDRALWKTQTGWLIALSRVWRARAAEPAARYFLCRRRPPGGGQRRRAPAPLACAARSSGGACANRRASASWPMPSPTGALLPCAGAGDRCRPARDLPGTQA